MLSKARVWLEPIFYTRHRTTLIVIGAVLVTVVVALPTFATLWLRENVLGDAEREMGKLSIVLAEHMARAVEGIDLVVSSTIDDIDTLEPGGPLVFDSRVQKPLRTRVARVPQVAAITVFDAAGNPVIDSQTTTPIPVNAAHREYFAAHSDDTTADLFVQALRSNSSAPQWTVVASRRINANNGSFRGIVAATLDLDYFRQFYEGLDPGPERIISLYRHDGALLASYPDVSRAIGSTRRLSAELMSILAASKSTTLRADGQDGVRRIIGAHVIPGYPLVIDISINQSQALARWRQQASIIGIGTLFGLSMIFLTGAILLGQSSRQEGLLREIHAARDEAEDARHVAESAGRAKSEFLASMSHELRTPLNAIIGFSEVLTGGYFGRLTAKQQEYVADINSAGKHLLELINDVLDMSKIEAGKMELHDEIVDVVAALKDSVRLVVQRASKAGIEVTIDASDNLPQLRCDLLRVKQIMLNLLSNAVKFTPPPGRVRASVARTDDGALILAIEDTGVGMTGAEIEIALQPFGQIDSPLSRSHEGTGLGLPLVKALVEMHEGRLAIISTPHRGTTVTAIFPNHRVIQSAASMAQAILVSPLPASTGSEIAG